MDDQEHPHHDAHDLFAREHELLEEDVERDLLDEPVLPLLGFPWVTLLVNLTGSLAIGFLVPLTEHVSHRAPPLRPLLMVGFLGGWTTYSTLAVDAVLLGKQGDVATGLAYLVATIVGGLALVVAGHGAGRRLVERRTVRV